MRIHVYEEELGEDIELIRKDNVNGNETFYGLRIWLKSPQEILDHSTPEDDDRNAVTFWARDVESLKFLVSQMRESVWRGFDDVG
jgi:hypothetical protein